MSGVVVELLQQGTNNLSAIKKLVKKTADYTFSERLASCYQGLYEINPDRIRAFIDKSDTVQSVDLIGIACDKTWLSFSDSLKMLIVVQNKASTYSKRLIVGTDIDGQYPTTEIAIPVLSPNQIYAQKITIALKPKFISQGQHTINAVIKGQTALTPTSENFWVSDTVLDKYAIIAPYIDHSALIEQSLLRINFTVKRQSTFIDKNNISVQMESIRNIADSMIVDTLWKSTLSPSGLNEKRIVASLPVSKEEIAIKRTCVIRLLNSRGVQVGAARLDIKPKGSGFFVQYDHTYTHKKLTEAAINLLSLQFGNKPWVQYFKNKMEIIKQGAFNEDGSYDLVGGRAPYNLYYLTYSHFWQADNSDSKRVKSDVYNALEEINSYIYGPLYLDGKALLTGSWYFDVWFYQSGSDGLMKYSSKYPDNDYTFDLLGRVMHLIQDMTVPAHIHEDLHGAAAGQLILGDESYENWLSGQHRFNEYNALDAGGIINPYLISKSNPIRGLAWSNAQVADYFASDGVNGNTSLGNRKDEIFQLNIGRDNNSDPRNALPQRPTLWYWDFSCRECQNWCFSIACPGKTYYDRIYAAPEQCVGANNKDCMSSPGRGFVPNNTLKDGICDQSNDCGDDDADGDLSRVAAKCYVRAIQSSAGFLYWFAKEKGMINPTQAGVTTFILND